MVKIIVDGKEYFVSEKKNLLAAVLSEKLNLQYFCWHPALGSVGACRQCAVKKFRDENDKTGKIVMACMEPVTDNAMISINDPEAKEFRAGIIEWLMTNHPHDCPVCDEGGECHLQDMTVMSGHNYRRYRFNKRTYRNQYLGPLINHEMNRCIQCYRCVRFYKDYADGKDFDAFGIHNGVYFGRAEDGVLENEFSGNLIEVCPTGVFTDKTLKEHYTRKWDLTNGPSICNSCSVGCNIIASERYGSLRRISTRYNSEVNGYFLCDRGRFGYEFVNSSKRVFSPLIREHKKGALESAEKERILVKAASVLMNKRIAGIGSPRASLESNFALMNLVGKENFYSGTGSREFRITALIKDLMMNGSVKLPSLNMIEKCEAVFILGEDVTNTAPMTALALRQASRKKPAEDALKLKIPEWHDQAVREIMQNKRGPFYIANPFPTKLDDIASGTYYGAPDDIARFGFALAGKISAASPPVNNIDNETESLINSAAESMKEIKSAVIVCGTSLLNENIIHSAYNLALAFKSSGVDAYISFIVPECNSIGLSLLSEKSFEDIINNRSDYDGVIILENDLYRRKPKNVVDGFLDRFGNVIVIDHLMTATAEKADLLISAGTFAESDGTLISNEGRAQRFYQVYDPAVFDNKKIVLESWRWIKLIGDSSGKKYFENLNTLYDFTEAVSKSNEIFKDITSIAPPPGYREAGQKIPRESLRFSGRTAMLADKSVHEPKPPEDIDSPLSYTMEGFKGQPPSSIIPFFWSPGWNSVQAINKYQIEVGGPLHGGDPGRRLFEPKEGSGKYFDTIPQKYISPGDELLILPIYHIYGSEELSNYSQPIQKLIPEPYAIINSNDLSKVKKEGNSIILTINDSELKLKAVINDRIKQGIIGIPFGMSKTGYFGIPCTVKVSL